MDPDVTVAQICTLLAELNGDDVDEQVAEIVDLLHGLADWLRRGGYRPAA